MAESKKLISKKFRLHNVKQLVESINEPANNAYYAFFGNHLDYANSAIEQPKDSVYETVVDVYRNMIFAKRISENDVKIMINRNDYTSNTVYDMYDDQVGESNVALFNSNYYAIVNADAYYHVFKCLDNNQRGYSTVEPSFSEINVNDEIYETSDGYIWKYMYSADKNTVQKFGTTEYFPVVPNTQVANAAKNGMINVIKVDNAGRGYDNFCNGTFRVDDLKIGGNALVYSINASLNANTTNTFYNNCYVYISAGTGSGQYSRISNYTVNSTIKAIVLGSEFTIPLSGDSVFEISPGVKITGDGTQTVNAAARAIINSSGNSIQKIEMLNLGRDYKFANAYVEYSNVVSVSNVAIIRPIYSPENGHGSDVAEELGATKICFSIKFSNTDIDIMKSNEYRTIGIIKDPVFANTIINLSNTSGSFLPNEKIYKLKGIRISDNATINTTSSVLTANADFTNQLYVGKYIYLTNGLNYQLTTVNSISNSSYITLKSNGYFSCTSTSIFLTDIGQTISNVNITPTVLTGNIAINTTSASANGSGTTFLTDLVPNTSYVFLYSNSTGGGEIKRVVSVANNTRLTFDSNCSFTNAAAKAQVINYNIVSNTTSGVEASTGFITSVATGTISISNVTGTFRTSDLIIGESSGATGVITTIQRNGTFKNFDTAITTYKYTGTPVSGTFTLDETIYQSETGLFSDAFATGKLAYIANNGSNRDYYITNQIGNFNTNQNILGANSGASALILDKYSPEILFGSGKVMYMEKIDPITRSNTTSETIKYIFNF